MSDRAPARRSLFPGDRRVWLTAAGVGSFFVVAIAIALLTPRDYYTGTNGVRLRSTPVELGRNIDQPRMCVPGQHVPEDTGRIELQVDTPAQRPRMDVEVRTADGRRLRTRELTPPTTGRTKVQFAIAKLDRDLAEAMICVRVHGDRVFFAGVGLRTEFDEPILVNGKPVDARIAIWYRPPAGEKRTVASLLPEILSRAALLRPGFVGTWTYVLILAVLLPGLIYAGLRLLATSGTERRRRIPVALAVGLIAFGHGVAWALVTPAFNAPDETEHYAYVQKLAETGKGLNNGPFVYSKEHARAVEATRVLSSNETGDGRPAWFEWQEERWEEAVRTNPLPRDDGGGVAPATSNHSPLYYSLLAPSYLATKSGSEFTTLTAARVTSTLFGAIVAVCAFLLVLELVPRRRLLAVAAGLLVAFHPMFAFLSGAVNNDMGVNALAALLLYLVVRAYARGITPGLGAAIGATLVLAPLMKGTAFALYPAVAVGLAFVLWRYRSRRTLVSLALLAATALVLFGAWSAVSGYFDRDTFTTPGGTAPGSNFGGVRSPGGLLSYLWQLFLPPLGFMTDLWVYPDGWPFFDIYVVRGWASFGWYAMTFSDWVYWVIVVVMPVVGAMAAAALWRLRSRIRDIGPPLLVLVLAIAALIAGVHAFYYPNGPRSPPFPEQGRYAFPLMVAFATIAVGSPYAFGRRWVVHIATTLVVAVMGMAYASQLLALTRFYS